MTPSDAILMQRIVARDEAAFSLLFARYQARVTELIYWMVSDASAADDLTQEVFLRVWNRAEQWSGRGSFRGWLFRMAKNLALNQLRNENRRREQPLHMPSLHDDEDEERPVPGWMIDRAALGPDVQLERAEQRRVLQELIDALPEEKREVFQLVYEDEVTLREAAKRLAIPEGTVKSRLFHARKQLASKFSRLKDDHTIGGI